MALTNRIRNILISPRTEWPVIAAEPTDVGSLYRGYIMPVSAIPVVAGLIGISLLGRVMPAGMGHLGGFAALGMAIVQYVLGLVGVWVVAFVIAKLAPRFGGREDMVQALKVAAYSATASWVAGAVLIIPLLGFLVIVGALYGLYLLYLGLPVVMGAAEDQAPVYTLAVVAVVIVLYLVVGALSGGVMAGMMGSMM
jgi:hypothetical protein